MTTRNSDLLLTLCAMLLVVGGMSMARSEPPATACNLRKPATCPEPLKRPALTLAVGRVESGLQPAARGKHGERGAWQIQPRLWGKVPRGLHAQALQHEGVLDQLLKECGGRMEQAVSRYNGTGAAARRYVGRVRREALCIALLEREVSGL